MGKNEAEIWRFPVYFYIIFLYVASKSQPYRLQKCERYQVY